MGLSLISKLAFIGSFFNQAPLVSICDEYKVSSSLQLKIRTKKVIKIKLNLLT